VKLKSVTANDISLTQVTAEEKQKQEEKQTQFKDMLELVKNTL
jgi:HSP90 family molecular chaperone